MMAVLIGAEFIIVIVLFLKFACSSEGTQNSDFAEHKENGDVFASKYVRLLLAVSREKDFL